MIQWVYERVKSASCFDKVIVATDDHRIEQCVKDFGGEVEMTRSDHASGSDRVWEVAEKYPQAVYVFNIQGDEPLINPLFLEEAVGFIKNHHEKVDIVTLKSPLHDLHEFEDPNIVKVVSAEDGRALYFSRAPIPYRREPETSESKTSREAPQWGYRHVGIYGFKRSSLQQFVQLPVSPLEMSEKLEQLRAMEAGLKLYCLTIPEAPIGVDTPADLLTIQKLLESSETATTRRG
jgi:3-deoxy-manno-octulosonate cytidylyltransferase (CMP-KDO synthetase)